VQIEGPRDGKHHERTSFKDAMALPGMLKGIREIRGAGSKCLTIRLSKVFKAQWNISFIT